jgi:peptidoglycan/xylan/chitin deacetylase (PgdA/CDA1 family)
MLRRLATTGLACPLHWTGADKLIGVLSGSGKMPLVIGYHRVVEDFTASAEHYIPGMLISCRMLERHLDWLGRRWRFLSLDELGARLESGEPFDKPVAAITFDDGYADLYHHAFPLLKRKGIPAGIFVVTDLIGTAGLQIYDRLYLLLSSCFSRWQPASQDLARVLADLKVRLPRLDNMKAVARDPLTATRALVTTLSQSEICRVIETLEAQVTIHESELSELHSLTWEMVSEMHRAGMTIGSHTKTHVLLPNEGWERVVDETASSRQVLEQRLGTSIIHFAYPGGQFNAATVSSVAEAGYRCAYTTCLHRSPLYPLLTIPRTIMSEDSGMDALGHFSPSILSCQARRVFHVAAACGHDHGVQQRMTTECDTESI